VPCQYARKSHAKRYPRRRRWRYADNADVLLANIDGYVIPADQIVPFIQRAKVRTFIPTHYSLSTRARWQGAPTIDEFIKTLPADLPVRAKFG
jgi:L-ascorbate metabolism protein UlaG (beta-lactamase superfamily)